MLHKQLLVRAVEGFFGDLRVSGCGYVASAGRPSFAPEIPDAAVPSATRPACYQSPLPTRIRAPSMQCDAVLRARRRKAPAAERRIRPVRGAKRETRPECLIIATAASGRRDVARPPASQAAGCAPLQ
jgi:hypothetical protein